MANYSAIKAAVNAYIKANGKKEITGHILNSVLNATIDSLGRYFQFAGGAMPTDNPGTPDQNVCYLAGEPGVYTNFGGITIENEEVALLFWDGEWTKQRILIGIQEVEASVDNQVGTPSVDVSYSGGVLVLTFHNLKGEQGDTGDPAGFGTIGADITGGVGTPGVSVETSGSNTAKNLMFHFTNLKGDTGVTSVVATIDDTSGTPSCQASLVNGVLTLAFSGLKGIKGDTGVSADYPITLYNGLDSDATDQALAAAQGKVLDGKISQLGQEVDGLKEGNYTKPDGVVTIEIPLSNKVDGIAALKSGSAFISSPYFAGYYYQVNQNATIDYRLEVSMTNYHIVICDNIPAVGVSFNGVAKGVSPGDTGSFSIDAGQYICILMSATQTTGFPELTSTKYTTINVLDLTKKLRNHRINVLAPTYFHGVRLVDTMTKQLWGLSTVTKIGNFTPVSATADTITLSTEDAACIVNTVILSCKFANGDYKNIYFSAASGNVITKLYDFGENLDCQNIEQMQSLHDTINGGLGIHLSPFGYRAMAHNIYNDLLTKKPFSDVFVGGWSAQFCLGSTAYTDPTIRDANGVTVCSPVTTGISVGGAVNKCEMRYAANISQSGPLYRTFYDITQTAPNGATVLFHIPSIYPFKGFLRINCARQPGNAGTASFTVKDYDGNTIVTKNIAYYADSYIIPLEDKYYEGVDVLISLPDNDQTKVMITEMTLHETYVELPQIRPIDSKSVVAMLGSSNTQFPRLETAEELCPGDPDNSIVEWPEGTPGDGCGYFGKELARVSGAVVDNWGKSGEQTPFGLEVIQKVFATKRYTHIVISLFANDINASRPMAETITNIRQMVEYAKGQGAIPIVIMGYATNTGNAVMRYALMYDDLSQGMDSPFIYTSAELHSA